MTTKNYHILLVLVLVLSYTSFPLVSLGQISEGGEPYSFTAAFTDKMAEENPLNPEVLPAMDVSDLEAANADGGGLQYYAKAYPVNFGLNNSGKWLTLDNGARLWRLQIQAKDAKSLEALYDDFYLPEGAKLFIYDRNGDHLLGAFTKNNNRDNGIFATSIVPGEVITFEYYEPAEVLGQGRIHINRLDYGFDDTHLPNKNFGSSDDCNINVNCSQGDNWQDEKRGIARISVRVAGGGSGWCSGGLINNTATDSRALFLTAWHCAAGDYSLINQWMFYFNFESGGCANGSDPGFQSITGASQLTDNENGDMLLLELDSSVPISYNPFYNGWNRGNTPNNNTVTGIHHPAGDIKKISVATGGYYSNNSSVTFGGGAEDLVIPAGNLWGCIWSEGTTEGGSSGSPLFDSNGRVLGVLTGGNSSCSNPSGANWYGKIAASWTQLDEYLDPLGTNPVTVNGLDPQFNFGDNVGVIKVEVETSPCEFTTSTPVNITIRNMGDNTQSNIPYRYILTDGDGTELLNQTATYNGTIASLQSVVITVNMDLSILGDYNIYSETTMSGDENEDDDATDLDISNVKATIASENFMIIPSNNSSSLRLSWTRGNGERVLVLMKEDTPFTLSDLPIDGVSYTASSIYGIGSFIGDAITVYKGTGTSVDVSNLDLNTTYYAVAIEFSCLPEFYLSDTYPETNYTITNLENQQRLNHVVNIYPNPTTDKVNISFGANTPQQLRIEIYNSLGQKLNEFNPDVKSNQTLQSVDISQLNQGIYFLKIYSERGFTHHKLLVK